MLSKDICKRCWNKETKNGWEKFHDRLWNEGVIECCYYLKHVFVVGVFSNKNIPEGCPYATEHVACAGGPMEIEKSHLVGGIDKANQHDRTAITIYERVREQTNNGSKQKNL